MRVTWDIFCSVVDNFGDIGVTWRLARQLVAVILPTNDGHPVKRVNYATEVNHDKTIRKEKNIPEAAFAGIQEGSFGTGGKNQHTEGRQGAGAS